MLNDIPLEFISNILSIVLVAILIFKYLKHKKVIDVIKKLDDLKNENNLNNDDLAYITQNQNEFKVLSEKADALAKFLNPLFILLVGVLFIYLPLSDAMIHLNVIVVAFILIQLDKINKKNTLTLLKGLSEVTKKEEKGSL
ncbi:MAG: hypothetical protein KA438_08870 [Aliarcobacter sp.]|jgi:C4-dicarboxylate transporter|nr:hypothetical protein [Aliarcobacter sp.]MBP7226408.1 hypothetical protein [Aliarcobacter sp.]MDX9959882.1 hypothetical protein [Aliarcobacter sp.]